LRSELLSLQEKYILFGISQEVLKGPARTTTILILHYFTVTLTNQPRVQELQMNDEALIKG
jgi:hypothetical protein